MNLLELSDPGDLDPESIRDSLIAIVQDKIDNDEVVSFPYDDGKKS